MSLSHDTIQRSNFTHRWILSREHPYTMEAEKNLAGFTAPPVKFPPATTVAKIEIPMMRGETLPQLGTLTQHAMMVLTSTNVMPNSQKKIWKGPTLGRGLKTPVPRQPMLPPQKFWQGVTSRCEHGQG